MVAYEAHRWGFTPRRLLPTLLWPVLLCAAFVFGLLVSVLWYTSEQAPQRPRAGSARRYFEPIAVCEAAVAILSGVLLWMGFWDFIDEYLVPREWWAKLCMLIVGGLGLFATRTLYDENTLLAIRGEEMGGTSCGLPSGPGDPTFIDAEMGPQPDTPHSEPALTSVVDAMSPPLFSSGCDVGPSDGMHTPSRMQGAQALPGTQPRPPRPRARRRCGCFDPPAFSCSRCSCALAATFSGLTMWVRKI